MPLSDRIVSLKERLGASRQVEDEKLLQLYWNRAELKKELTRSVSQRERLLEYINKQDGAATKLREQIDQLRAASR